ncbi:MAG: hypothetical protein KDD41_09910 [Flavobacteriales bacterium]|nr:hypothetical protein [Flavobacteriales bacterium]
MITALLLFLHPVPDNKWKLEKDKNNIKVYSHIPEGSELKEIRMVSKANADLSHAVSVLMDVEGYSKWIYNCRSAKIVKHVKEREIIYYSVTAAPWPLIDRDLVVHNKIYQNPKTKAVFSQSMATTDVLAPVPGKIRITDLYGLWKFTPLGNGEIEIEYYIRVDPAGILPPWVVNMFISTGPYQSMLKFKEQLKKEEHQVKLDFIEE